MRGPVAVLALAGLLGGLVAGCTDTTRPPADDAGVELPSDLAPDLPRATATSTGPVLPDPNFERPHTALGEQLRARFPPPRQLGPGWAFPPTDERHVEVPLAVERDAEEVVDGAVPEDCSRLNPMPLPDAAAQEQIIALARARAERNAGRPLVGEIDFRLLLPPMGGMSGGEIRDILRRALEEKVHAAGQGQEAGLVTTQDLLRQVDVYRRIRAVVEKIRYGQYL